MLGAGQPSGANTIVADPLAVPNDEPTDVDPGSWPSSVVPRGSVGLTWADVVEDETEAVASVTKADEASVEEISSDEPTEQQEAEALVQQQEQEALAKKEEDKALVIQKMFDDVMTEVVGSETVALVRHALVKAPPPAPSAPALQQHASAKDLPPPPPAAQTASVIDLPPPPPAAQPAPATSAPYLLLFRDIRQDLTPQPSPYQDIRLQTGFDNWLGTSGQQRQQTARVRSKSRQKEDAAEVSRKVEQKVNNVAVASGQGSVNAAGIFVWDRRAQQRQELEVERLRAQKAAEEQEPKLPCFHGFLHVRVHWARAIYSSTIRLS